jgi:AcrR family transcriptional regulator
MIASVTSQKSQPADGEVRRRLLEAAARLISEEGMAGLSVRRLATEVGTSTMAVYTYFGGLPELVRAVVGEGFARLAQHMSEVPQTDDPTEDLLGLAWAYRANALDNPQLYAVMFGSASLGGYRRSGDELEEGRYTFDVLVAATKRVIDAGFFRSEDPEHVAAQLWSALHGYVMLELAGYFAEEPDAVNAVLVPLLINLGVGLASEGGARS